VKIATVRSKGTGQVSDHIAADSSAADRILERMPSERAVIDTADVFSLLGDAGRVRILSALLHGPLRVRDIAQAAHLSESSASHALRLLRAHRVVSVRREGREAHYELDDVHVRALLQLALDHMGHTEVEHEDH
jgi:ArsR family transcriptional regulator, lead/cadmium/zinc/bismuth-responsive transcriptional repressor